jgi:hypothetical protein
MNIDSSCEVRLNLNKNRIISRSIIKKEGLKGKVDSSGLG